MTLDQLRYFLETAKFQHVGKAASSLNISRSAISNSISLLEDELGQVLFRKTGRNIVLTPQGRLLKGRSEEILSQVDELAQEFQQSDFYYYGHYRLGSSHFLSSKLLLPAWNQLVKKYNQMTAEVYTNRSSIVIEQVAKGELDLGLCFSPQASRGLNIVDVHEDRLEIFVRKGHPLAGKRFISSSLNSFRCTLPMSFGGVDVCETHPMFESFGIEPKISMAFDSYWAAVARVAQSDDWTLLPTWVAKVSGHPLVSISPKQKWDAPVRVSVVTRSMRTLPPALEALIKQLKKSHK